MYVCICICIHVYIYIYILHTPARRSCTDFQLCDFAIRIGALRTVLYGYEYGHECKPAQNSDSEFSVRRLTLVCRCWVFPGIKTNIRKWFKNK